MFISICICTWNRGNFLEQTLKSLCNNKIPVDICYEVVIVNNNCTDNTDDVVLKFQNILPIVYVFEDKPGLSHARNKAILVANGDYIIWTDDDVLVDEGWITGYVDAFIVHPEAVIFGGPVHPWFEGTPPSWILEGWEAISSAFATRDFGDTSFLLDPDHLPFGANFAVRTSEQKSVKYDPNFGLSHGKIVLGEESIVMNQLLSRGLTGWWVPASKVLHWIPATRQSISYVRKYYVGYGRTLIKRSKNVPMGLLNKPKWLWKKAIISELTYYYNRLFKSSKIWVNSLKNASINWGELFDGIV